MSNYRPRASALSLIKDISTAASLLERAVESLKSLDEFRLPQGPGASPWTSDGRDILAALLLLKQKGIRLADLAYRDVTGETAALPKEQK